MASKIKLRRGEAQEWLDANNASPVILSIGEPGFETDTHKLKIGDGTNNWADLPYVNEGNLSITDNEISANDDGEITVSTNGNTWRFGTDGSLGLPGGGWGRDADDIYANNSLSVTARGDALRLIWNNTAPFQSLGSNDAVWDRLVLDQTGFTVSVSNKVGDAIVPRFWVFNPDGRLTFPDGESQTTAWNSNSTIDYSRITNVPPPVVTPAAPPVAMANINMDGGSAGTVYEAQAVILYADGGGAGSRFGINDTIIDGNIGNYIIDGGVGA